MQKLMTVLGLLLSITGELFAQQRVPKEMTTAQYQALSPEERLFTRAPHSIGIDYTITLDRGNKLIMSLANGHDLHTFENIDSLLTVFLSDLKPLRDSLADPMTIKRIDYLIDTSGHKKMRILQNRPTGTSFLVGGNEPALLKIAQDTINILIVTKVARHGEGKNVDGLRYDRLCFLLNRYSDLDAYAAGGFNDTVHTILSGIKEPHHPYLGPFFYTYRSPTIKPYTHYGNGLLFSATADIQNYRNYFVPSFTLNGAVNLTRDRSNYIIGAFWQPLFFFTTNAQGQVQTFRNDLVGVAFTDYNTEHPDGWQPTVFLGWIVYHPGAYFDNQPAFSLGIGAWHHGPISIGPSMYFDRFFRHVTPSLQFSFTAF
jgi:hypothetical protein